MNSGRKYDIFISYRRTTGANAARMMQIAFVNAELSVSVENAWVFTF